MGASPAIWPRVHQGTSRSTRSLCRRWQHEAQTQIAATALTDAARVPTHRPDQPVRESAGRGRHREAITAGADYEHAAIMRGDAWLGTYGQPHRRDVDDRPDQPMTLARPYQRARSRRCRNLASGTSQPGRCRRGRSPDREANFGRLSNGDLFSAYGRRHQPPAGPHAGRSGDPRGDLAADLAADSG